jgi:hypothetical protein
MPALTFAVSNKIIRVNPFNPWLKKSLRTLRQTFALFAVSNKKIRVNPFNPWLKKSLRTLR